MYGGILLSVYFTIYTRCFIPGWKRIGYKSPLILGEVLSAYIRSWQNVFLAPILCDRSRYAGGKEYFSCPFPRRQVEALKLPCWRE